MVPFGRNNTRQQRHSRQQTVKWPVSWPVKWTVALTVILLLALVGCTRRTPPPVPGSQTGGPSLVWQAFQANWCAGTPAQGIGVKASLYYSRPHNGSTRGNRTVVEFWGDLALPLRLNVSAGVGSSLAFILENHDGLLAYYPGSHRAYMHGDPVAGAQRLGLPLPFSLEDLAHVLAGDLSLLTPPTYDTARELTSNGDGVAGWEFGFNGGDVASLRLDEAGRPLRLVGLEPSGAQWSLDFDNYPDLSPKAQADKLTLTLSTQERGVLRIKSRELRDRKWEAKALGLDLPEGTEYLSLDLPVPERVIFQGSE